MSIENRKTRRRHAALNRNGRKVAALVAASAFAALATPALAFEIDTGNPEVKIHWDTQLKYTAAFRVEGQSEKLTNVALASSVDDGDRNFDKGLISNRFDVFSEFDVSYRGWGVRASGAGWYDQVYNEDNDNDSALSVNKPGENDAFAHGTEELHGRKAELLDAFVFGRFDTDTGRVSFRAGRFAQFYGETLYYGANGIAGGMAPIDAVKALSVPNVLFKELLRPVGQVSAQWSLNENITVGAYYQFEWQRTVIPGAGSYFSNVDFLDAGGTNFVPPLIGGPFQSPRFEDDAARGQGQFGAQVRFRVPGWSPDFGIYAIHYHAKTPNVNIALTDLSGVGAGPFVPQGYNLVYAEDITAVGASISNTFGEVNIAAEASMRFNAPLSSHSFGYIPAFGGTPSTADNPGWAVGHTVHMNVSAIWQMGPNFITKEGSITAEIAANQMVEVTENPGFRNFNSQHTGMGIFINYEPAYRQVLPGLDITVPMGVAYAPMGNDAAGIFQVDDGGSANIGLAFTYLDTWRAGVQYTRYLGPTGPSGDAGGVNHYDQSLKDRDFVSINIRRTF